jgi:hypothetical protein
MQSIDGKPTVISGEHVGGGSGANEAREPEPADHAAAHPLGECGQVCGGNSPIVRFYRKRPSSFVRDSARGA